MSKMKQKFAGQPAHRRETRAACGGFVAFARMA